MACFHPWKPHEALGLAPALRLPCGQCVGCRLRRSSEQATRCIHETKQHRFNSWLTLTYDDEHLPQKYFTGLYHPKTRRPIYSGSLHKTHVQRFIRAMRKALSRKGGGDLSLHYEYLMVHTDMGLRPIPQLRYYYAGEYGELYQRPHYHVCLFGIDFADKKHVDTTDHGFNLYESKRLAELWPHGKHMIGDLTWETAAYTARYLMKKVTGQKAENHYRRINLETGEIINLVPEYNDMSRRPGIGHDWYMKFHQDVHKSTTSHVRVRGVKTKPPRYYDKLHKRYNPEHAEIIKKQRRKELIKKAKNFTQNRLNAEEIITNAKIKSLSQKLEDH